MQLSIIIINYNTFWLTCNCIQSIRGKLVDLDYEIILVDNDSSECDPQLFAKQFPELKLIVSAENTGFTGGNNIGLSRASGDYILLLNSDTELINNAPKICYDYMQQHPEAGVTTAQLSYPDGKIQYNCRRFRTISWELLEIFPLYRLMPKRKREQLMLHHYFDHKSSVSCDWVWGTFMLFPRKIISALPGNQLPADFFMYVEDVLWCWQIKKLGYQIVFLPEAKVMHIHKGSTSKENLKQVRLLGVKNHAKFMRKFYPDLRWYLFAAVYYAKQYAAMLLGK